MSSDQAYLVQLFLPLADNDGRPIPVAHFDRVFDELTERFGGVTAFQRSPADGAWKPREGAISYDRVVAYEVVVQELDAGWWTAYRQRLEDRFRQERILVRALAIMLL